MNDTQQMSFEESALLSGPSGDGAGAQPGAQPDTLPGAGEGAVRAAEQALYSRLAPALGQAMDRWQLPRSMLRLRQAKSYASVLVGNVLLCRLYADKRTALEIPCADTALVPAEYPEECVRAGKDKIRLDLPQGADAAQAFGPVLAPLAQRVASQFPKTFDCCHRYLACSDAGHCVNPDAAQAIGCGYKRVLTEGKCYYGKNRNV